MPVRNAPSVIPTTLRFIASRLSHRLRGGAASVSACAYRDRVDAVLTQMKTMVDACDWIEVAGDAQAWINTGIEIGADVPVTLLASGRVYVSRALDVGFGPSVGLWYRLGDGAVSKQIGDACTLQSAGGGTLSFTTKPSGEFADPGGTFDAAVPREALSGSFLVAVIRWRTDALPALQTAAELDAELFAPALQRFQTPVEPPAGWHYLWRLGRSEIYRACDDDAPALCCHTRADVGILQFPLRRPLTAATQLSWNWCVEQLPSKLPEHTPPTHDYLSIAIEFDNGLDLTWMWSAGLPTDTIFQCPLPWWDQRETHWVIRSGTAELGQWLSERRDVLADYARAIGGPPPQAIVAVWLIANTAFQRGEGKCQYRRIVVSDESGEAVVQA